MLEVEPVDGAVSSQVVDRGAKCHLLIDREVADDPGVMDHKPGVARRSIDEAGELFDEIAALDLWATIHRRPLSDGLSGSLKAIEIVRPLACQQPASGFLVGGVDRVKVDPACPDQVDRSSGPTPVSDVNRDDHLAGGLTELHAVGADVAVGGSDKVEACGAAEVDQRRRLASPDHLEAQHKQSRATHLVGLGAANTHRIDQLVVVVESELQDRLGVGMSDLHLRSGVSCRVNVHAAFEPGEEDGRRVVATDRPCGLSECHIVEHGEEEDCPTLGRLHLKHHVDDLRCLPGEVAERRVERMAGRVVGVKVREERGLDRSALLLEIHQRFAGSSGLATKKVASRAIIESTPPVVQTTHRRVERVATAIVPPTSSRLRRPRRIAGTGLEGTNVVTSLRGEGKVTSAEGVSEDLTRRASTTSRCDALKRGLQVVKVSVGCAVGASTSTSLGSTTFEALVR